MKAGSKFKKNGCAYEPVTDNTYELYKEYRHEEISMEIKLRTIIYLYVRHVTKDKIQIYELLRKKCEVIFEEYECYHKHMIGCLPIV